MPESIEGQPRSASLESAVSDVRGSRREGDPDSLIDPDGDLPITDYGAARTFFEKVGREGTIEEVRQVIELRKAARRFVVPADEENR